MHPLRISRDQLSCARKASKLPCLDCVLFSIGYEIPFPPRIELMLCDNASDLNAASSRNTSRAKANAVRCSTDVLQSSCPDAYGVLGPGSNELCSIPMVSALSLGSVRSRPIPAKLIWRLWPSGRSVRLGALGRSRPRALPPMYGNSYVANLQI